MPELGKATYVVELETRKFDKGLDAIEKRTAATTKNVSGSTTQMGKSFDRAGTSISGTDKQVKSLGQTMNQTRGTITKVDKDTTHLHKGLINLNQSITAIGHAVKLVKWPTLITGAGLAIQAISALAGGAVALTASLGQATSGLGAMVLALGQATPAIAGLGAAYAAMAQAMITVKISGVSKAFAVLSSNATTAENAMKMLQGPAKKFGETLQSMKPKFDALRNAAGKGLFPGLSAGIKAAMKNSDAFEKVLGATGKALGNLARQLGNVIGSKGFGREFQAFGMQNARVLEQLGGAAIDLFRAFIRVMNVAKPFVNWLADSVATWARAKAQMLGTKEAQDDLSASFDRAKRILQPVVDVAGALWETLKNLSRAAFPTGLNLWKDFATWMEGIAESTGSKGGQSDLEAFFARAGTALKQWMHLLGNVGAALMNIFHAAAGPGAELVHSLNEGAKNLREWTESTKGQNELKQYFEDIVPVVKEFGRLLRDITYAFVDLGRDPKGLKDTIKTIRTELLPMVKDLIGTSTERLSGPLLELLKEAGKVWINLAGASGPLVIFLKTVALVLKGVNALLSNQILRSMAVWAIVFASVSRIAIGVVHILQRMIAPIVTVYGWGKGFATQMKIAAAASLVAVNNMKTGFAAGAAGNFAAVPYGKAGLAGGSAGNLGRGLSKTLLPTAAAGMSETAAALAGLGAAAAIVVAALGAITGAILAVKDNFLGVRDALKGFFEWIGGAIKGFLDAISMGHGDAIMNALATAANALGDAFSFLGKHLKQVLEIFGLVVTGIVAMPIIAFVAAFTVTLKAVTFVINAVRTAISFLIKVFKDVAKWVGGAVVAAFHALVTAAKAVVGAITTAFRAVLGPIKTVANALGTYFTNVWKDISGAYADVARAIAGVASKIFNAVKQPFVDAWNWVKQLPGKILNALSAIWQHSAFKKIFDALKGPFVDAWNWVKSLPGKIISAISSLWGGGRRGGGPFGKIFDAIKSPFVDAWNWVKGLPRKILNALSAIWKNSPLKKIYDALKGPFVDAFHWIESLPGKIASIFNKVVSKLKSIGGAILDAIKSPFVDAGLAIWSAIKWVIEHVISKIPGVPDISIGSPPFGGGGYTPTGSTRHPGAGNVPGTSHRQFGGIATHPQVLVGEQAPAHPEYVIATNPAYRRRNVALLQQAAHRLGIPGFSTGGDLAKAAASGPGAIGAAALKALLHTLPDFGLPGWAGGFRDWLIDQITGLIDKHMGGGGLPRVGVGPVSIGPGGVGVKPPWEWATGGVIGMQTGGVIGGGGRAPVPGARPSGDLATTAARSAKKVADAVKAAFAKGNADVLADQRKLATRYPRELDRLASPAKERVKRLTESVIGGFSQQTKDVLVEVGSLRKGTVTGFDETRKGAATATVKMRQATLADVSEMQHGMAAATAKMKSQTAADLSAAGKSATEAISKMRRTAQGDLDALGKQGADAIGKLHRSASSDVSSMAKSVTGDTQKMRRVGGNDFDNFRQDALDSTGKLHRDATGDIEQTRKSVIDDTGKARKQGSSDFENLRKSVTSDARKTHQDAAKDFMNTRKDIVQETGKTEKGGEHDFNSLRDAVAKAIRNIGENVNKALKALGVNTVDFGVKTSKHQRGGVVQLQTGGMLVGGSGSGDKVHALLEPGEVVWNREAVAKMGGVSSANAVNSIYPRFQEGGEIGGSSHEHMDWATEWVRSTYAPMFNLNPITGASLGRIPLATRQMFKNSAAGQLALKTAHEAGALGQFYAGQGGWHPTGAQYAKWWGLQHGGILRAQRGTMVDPTWDPGSERLNAIISPVVGKWARAYKTDMTAGYDPGGSHVSPGHNVTGTATDMVPLSGTDPGWDLLEKGLRAIIGHVDQVLYGTHGVGTPYANHGRYNHAHIEWGMHPDVQGLIKAQVAKQTITGPKGPLRTMGQAAVDKVRAAAQRYVSKKLGGLGGADVFPPGAGTLSKPELRRLMKAHGMPDIMGWIAEAESSRNAQAIGHDAGGTIGYGLWQITSGFNDELIRKYGGPHGILDPDNNAEAAMELYRGRGTQPWDASSGTWGSHVGQPYRRGGVVRLARGGGVATTGGSIGTIDRFIDKLRRQEEKGKAGHPSEVAKAYSKEIGTMRYAKQRTGKWNKLNDLDETIRELQDWETRVQQLTDDPFEKVQGLDSLIGYLRTERKDVVGLDAGVHDAEDWNEIRRQYMEEMVDQIRRVVQDQKTKIRRLERDLKPLENRAGKLQDVLNDPKASKDEKASAKRELERVTDRIDKKKGEIAWRQDMLGRLTGQVNPNAGALSVHHGGGIVGAFGASYEANRGEGLTKGAFQGGYADIVEQIEGVGGKQGTGVFGGRLGELNQTIHDIMDKPHPLKAWLDALQKILANQLKEPALEELYNQAYTASTQPWGPGAEEQTVNELLDLITKDKAVFQNLTDENVKVKALQEILGKAKGTSEGKTLVWIMEHLKTLEGWRVGLEGVTGTAGTIATTKDDIHTLLYLLQQAQMDTGRGSMLDFINMKLAEAGLTETLDDDILWTGKLVKYWQAIYNRLVSDKAPWSEIADAASQLASARSALQSLIDEKNAAADQGTGDTVDTSQKADDAMRMDLLSQLLAQRTAQLAVSQAQYPVFAGLPQFAGGGIVPGRTSQPVPVIAHGKEGVFTTDQMEAMGGPGDVSVTLHGDLHTDGRSLEEAVEVTVNKQLAKNVSIARRRNMARR